MSDHDDPPVESFDDPVFEGPAFDDPAHDELRALLADVRATGPVPDDVAARLDATLTTLQEERHAEATVVPLRRRRAVARFLVAAAAVVVVGVGGVGIANLAQNDANNSARSADSAASSTAGDSVSSTPAAPEALSGSNSPAPTSKAQLNDLKGAAALPQFSTARFAEEAAAFDPATGDFGTDTTSTTGGKADEASTPAESDAPDAVGRTATTCVGPSLPDTTTVPILLDGQQAMLVVHEVVDGTQEVDAWSCDGKQELTTTTVTR